jgi:Tol biopolymer transport system component
VSTSDAEVKANYGSADSAISGDGTKVAFRSHATNLDPNDADYSSSDIYVKDLRTGDVTGASTSDTGARAWGPSFQPALSADGTRVAFSTTAPNLDPADPDWDSSDIYVKDLRTGNIMLASTSEEGIKGNGESFNPTRSADDTLVSFTSAATNLDAVDDDTAQDIYVKDLRTGEVILASTSDTGTKATDSSFAPTLSPDGTKVAFHSGAANLDPSDTDTTEDVYVKNLLTGNIMLASTSDQGLKGNGSSLNPSLSADGLIVAFQSASSNLDPGDLDFDFDVYVKDLTTGELVVASTTHTGGPSGGTCSDPSLSGDGTKVAFRSSANLHPDDTGLGAPRSS